MFTQTYALVVGDYTTITPHGPAAVMLGGGLQEPRCVTAACQPIDTDSGVYELSTSKKLAYLWDGKLHIGHTNPLVIPPQFETPGFVDLICLQDALVVLEQRDGQYALTFSPDGGHSQVTHSLAKELKWIRFLDFDGERLLFSSDDEGGRTIYVGDYLMDTGDFRTWLATQVKRPALPWIPILPCPSPFTEGLFYTQEAMATSLSMEARVQIASFSLKE